MNINNSSYKINEFETLEEAKEILKKIKETGKKSKYKVVDYVN